MTRYEKFVGGVIAGLLMAVAAPTQATTGTWTNYVSGGSLSDYWTNNLSWSPGPNKPGNAGVFDSALLTNNVTIAYTNILNFGNSGSISTLAISNNFGEAWLVITNTALTNSTFAINSGGRLQIDNGGVVTGITGFTWLGTNGAIYLNNGGKLFTAPVAGISINGGSVTALVASVNGPGNGGVWDMGSKALAIGSSTTGNLLAARGGVTITNVSSLAVGSSVGANNNSLIVTGDAGFFMTGGGGFWVGAGTASASAGGNNNAVILSNAVLLGSTISAIGSSSSNNLVTLLGVTDWNNKAAGLYVGYGNTAVGATGNVLSINSGFVTNVGALFIGAGASTTIGASISNRLVTGAVISNVTKLIIGGNDGSGGSDNSPNNNYNSLIVTNGGGFSMDSGQILVGAARTGTIGGSFNTVVLSNGVLGSVGTVGLSYVGRNSSSNSLTLLSGIFWNGASSLNIGAAGTGNVMTVNGAVVNLGGGLLIGSVAGGSGNQLVIVNDGIVSNVTSLSVGGVSGAAAAGANNNSLIATNGSFVMGGTGGFFVGGAGSTFVGGQNNTVLLSNAVIVGSSVANNNSTIGNGSSNNIVTLLGTTIWNNNSRNLYVGVGGTTAAATGNVLTLTGGLVTNVGVVYVGVQVGGGVGVTAGISISNRVVTGAVFSNVTQLIVGGSQGAQLNDITPGNNYNSFIVTNGGGFNMSSGQFLVGASRSGTGNQGGNYNTVILSNGLLTVTVASFIGGASSSNTVTFLPGLTWNGAVALSVGTGAATGNVWNINGAVVSNLTLTVGTTAASLGNAVLINNGGLLQANSLVTGIGVGNTISNVGGIYQFTTGNPTVTRGSGVGSIAITDGTISFANTAFNLTNNWRGTLTNITFAGNNTLRLNNSVATNTLAGPYTFDTGLGATNYHRLEMLHGNTGVAGNGITIGAAGSMLVSNTTATISGLVTNHGSLRVVGATATFQSPVINSGMALVQHSALTVSGTLTNDGTLSFLHSVGTFNSAVVNRGAWITDPTTNIFLSSYTVTTNGYISASAGDVFRFHNGLQNQSTNKVAWQTLNVTPGTNTMGGGTLFEFTGTSVTQTQVFEHPGLLLTGGFVGAPTPLSNGVQEVAGFGAVTGFQDNFAVGQLWLTNTTLVLAGGTGGALFVNDLFLFGGAQLVVSNDLRLYFVNSNGWDLASITLLGGSEIHQLHAVVVIPEPNVLLLCVAGFATLCLARRRRQRKRLL